MPTQTRSARSLLALAAILSLVVAGSPGAALGHQPVGSAAAATLASGPQPSLDARDAVNSAWGGPTVDDARGLWPRGLRALDRPALSRSARSEAPEPFETPAATRVAWVTRATPDVPQPKPKSVSAAESSSGGASASSFKGSNHLWIPALGINRSVSFFSCSSTAYPGNRVYRWGCAGSNNVYLFGHAYSVFKPLHDAYVRGRLSKGMKVMYADGNGRVSTYAVSWWKITTPDKGAWAYAAQSRPSLTLQTCVGANSQYRLIVRLLKVG
jgi:sortase (surface protein transpeptidase)